MDTVCKSNLGINANSFFMIMPFVKRLKRWLHDNKAPAALTTAGGLPAATLPQPYPQPQQKAKKALVAPTPVGTTQKKRQRHKSMGDLDGIKPSPLKLSASEIVATVPIVPVPPAKLEPAKRNKPKPSITKRQLFSATGDTQPKPAADAPVATITAIQRRLPVNAQYSIGMIDKNTSTWQLKLNNDPAIAKWKNFRFNNKTRLCQCVF